MIQITPQMRILVAVQAVDFRKGIDGLVGVCRGRLQKDPFSGCVFVFRNRRGTSIKVLMYDGQGYWLCQKRLSKGKFNWWPKECWRRSKRTEYGGGRHRAVGVWARLTVKQLDRDELIC